MRIAPPVLFEFIDPLPVVYELRTNVCVEAATIQLIT